MTIWGVVGIWLGVAAYAVAWLQGGRPERFAAAVMLCVVATMSFAHGWESDKHFLVRMILDCVRLLVFGRLFLRSNRWWPSVMTAVMGLMIVADVVRLLSPDISYAGVVSAKVGLGYLVSLTLLFGVYERWLAGEAPASRAAWTRAHIATRARRNRRIAARRSAAMPAGEPAKAGIT